MLLHRAGMLRWIWKALFSPLAADGDSTGGSNAAATPQPADGTDHPSLKDLKSMCHRAWMGWPVKVRTQPFKADVWSYFYPCEDTAQFAIGEVPSPYAGSVKSIFLDDNQKPLSRQGGLSLLPAT